MPQFPSVFGASGIWTLKKQRRAAGGLDWPPLNGADPQFRNVTMLLHGNGTNGAQNNTFVDSSSNNISITRNGTTAQGTFSPYGDNWSNFFDGSGDWLTAPANAAYDFGTGNFTVEFWFNRTAPVGQSFHDSFIGNRPSGFSSGMWHIYTGPAANDPFSWQARTPAGDISLSGGTCRNGEWNHIAVVRNGNTITLYINGTSVNSLTTTTSIGNSGSPISIGAFTDGAYPSLGHFSNVRVVKGTAVYTSNFTPSTIPLTAVSGTSLLTCQANRFRDASGNNFTITRNGNVSVQRFSPFAPTAGYSVARTGGSAWFDGSTGYLQTASSGGFNAGTGSWTIEGWFYIPRSGAQEAMVVAQTSGGVDRFYIRWRGPSGSKLFIGDDAINLFDGSGLDYKPINQWTHIALTREGNLYTLYLNGVFYASDTAALINTATSTFQIGANLNQEFYSNIYICDLRYSQSVVYRSNFTPPTSPLSGGSFLLGGRNAGVIDNAMMNDIQTVGNAQISTAQSRFGGGSIALDGSGDNLVSSDRSQGDFGTGDFTVELWWRSAGGTGFYQTWVEKGVVSGVNVSGAWSFGPFFMGNSLWFAYVAGGSFNDITASVNPNDGAWHHCAVSRQGTSLRMFFDGVLVNTTTVTASLGSFTNYPLNIGYNERNGRYINGNIDDLRITRGVARYTANFTPPAAPFPDQ